VNEARRIEVGNAAYFRLIEGDGSSLLSDIADAIAVGIETALGWHEGDEVLKAEGAL
jgi:hypothetical protein